VHVAGKEGGIVILRLSGGLRNLQGVIVGLQEFRLSLIDGMRLILEDAFLQILHEDLRFDILGGRLLLHEGAQEGAMLLRARWEELGLHLETRADMANRGLDLRLRKLIDHPVIKSSLTFLGVNGLKHAFRDLSFLGSTSSQVLRVYGHSLIILSRHVLIHVL
jgi:hypothetical protein